MRESLTSRPGLPRKKEAAQGASEVMSSTSKAVAVAPADHAKFITAYCSVTSYLCTFAPINLGRTPDPTTARSNRSANSSLASKTALSERGGRVCRVVMNTGRRPRMLGRCRAGSASLLSLALLLGGSLGRHFLACRRLLAADGIFFQLMAFLD